MELRPQVKMKFTLIATTCVVTVSHRQSYNVNEFVIAWAFLYASKLMNFTILLQWKFQKHVVHHKFQSH